jgi:hypothetical protein
LRLGVRSAEPMLPLTARRSKAKEGPQPAVTGTKTRSTCPGTLLAKWSNVSRSYWSRASNRSAVERVSQCGAGAA